jgi:hypothetical protein
MRGVLLLWTRISRVAAVAPSLDNSFPLTKCRGGWEVPDWLPADLEQSWSVAVGKRSGE